MREQCPLRQLWRNNRVGLAEEARYAAIYDLPGALLLAVSVAVFASGADFAPGGVSGLAVLLHVLFSTPIGLMTVIINIPIILLTFRSLGAKFFVLSVKTVLICAFFQDIVVAPLPVFTGARWIAAILSGICAGIGYALIFHEGSSTGGTDFVIVAVKKKNPRLSFGLLAFLIDSIVIVLSVFVYSDLWSFVYGMVYTVVTSLVLDAMTRVLEKVTGHKARSLE